MLTPSPSNVSGAAEGLLELLNAADALRPDGDKEVEEAVQEEEEDEEEEEEEEVPAPEKLEEQASTGSFEEAMAAGQATRSRGCSIVCICLVVFNAALYQVGIAMRGFRGHSTTVTAATSGNGNECEGETLPRV